MSPIRTAVAGFGISAKVFHAPFIHTMPEFELVSVQERNREDSKLIYPEVKVVKTFEELISDPTIELVVVTTPNDTHFPYAAAAMRAGKHVVLEKPFTNTTRDAQELIDISKETGTLLSVYQNRRYVSDFLTIKEILGKKLLGEVHEFVAHYDRYRAEARPNAWREKPEPGSGILYDLGSHLIDQALHLFGMPNSITADIKQQRPHAKTDDYFEIWMQYDNLKVRLHSGMLVREMGPRYMVHGTVGSFIKSGEDPQEAALKAGEMPIGHRWGHEDPLDEGILHTVIDGAVERRSYPTLPGNFGSYYKNIWRAIRQHAPLTETAMDGYRTIFIIEKAFESWREGRTITLS